MRMQTELHFHRNSFETMIYEELCIICKIKVSKYFLTGISEIDLAPQPPMFLRSAIGGGAVFLRWSCGMRRATGERYERGLRWFMVAISHASHDYVRAAESLRAFRRAGTLRAIFWIFENFLKTKNLSKPSFLTLSDLGTMKFELCSSRAFK